MYQYSHITLQGNRIKVDYCIYCSPIQTAIGLEVLREEHVFNSTHDGGRDRISRTAD